MNTRTLMSAAAVVLALGGLGCTFAPVELLGAMDVAAAAPAALVVQALGAAWLGFALLDWHARGAPFGGIYGRPVALGNFLHFTVVAAALLKAASAAPAAPLIGLAALSTAFALAFGGVLFFKGAPD